MNKIFRFIFLIMLAFAVTQPVYSQVNPATVDVNSLTDKQIQQIVDEVNSRGLSMEQAALLARAQGASPAQIEQIMQRIRGMNTVAAPAAKSTVGSDVNAMVSEKTPVSVKKEVVVSEKAKQIFGYHLFNNANLTFEPAVNIPVPSNYVIGIGDQIAITVWGASQNVYSLKVDQNGAVNIPDIGPVRIMGMSIENARLVIKNRLITIYNGMAGGSPNTWAEVSVTNLRSIKINVIGDVNVPGTYTVPATASAFNVLYLSGGPNENGSFRKIQVIRDNKIIQYIDVYDFLVNGITESNISLRDQDIVFIPTYEKRVETNGSFKRNGFYELKDREPIENLIKYAGGFADNAYQGQLSVTRIIANQRQINDVLQSEYKTFLPQNGDIVSASVVLDRYENRVFIEGAVFRPGTYQLTPGLTLSGLINKAQGLRENVYSNRGMLVRLKEDLTPVNISFDVNEVMNGTSDIFLQREDAVVIRTIEEMREERSVQIIGQVQNPGSFSYSENMTLKDFIFMAGGFTEAASESFIEVSRRNSYEKASEISSQLVSLFQFDIKRDLTLDSEQERFVLQPFDYVFIRRAPSYFTQRTVSINGEVKYPGSYNIQSKEERISDLIIRAGGLTPTAFVKGATMNRAPQNIDLVMKSLSNVLPDSLITESQAKLINPKLELRLNEILNNPGTLNDYVLKDGDQIFIPEVIEEIRVSGEILNPIGLAFQPGKSVLYYINQTGGFSTKAHRRKVYVIYADGTTAVTKGFIFRAFPGVEPGSQIVVPLKPEKTRTDQTGKWLAIASTLASIGVTITYLLK